MELLLKRHDQPCYTPSMEVSRSNVDVASFQAIYHWLSVDPHVNRLIHQYLDHLTTFGEIPTNN